MRPYYVAIVGAGPSGFFAAASLLRFADESVAGNGPDVHIDMLEMLPTPWGLVRSGVAPDHPKIKSISRTFEKTSADPRFRFFGNITVGQDVSVDELADRYDAVVYAVGTQSDRTMGIPGEDLPGVLEALPFLISNVRKCLDLAKPDEVYHDMKGLNVVVLGGGDTAMDCNRTSIRQGAASVTCAYRRDEKNMPGSKREVANAREEGVHFLWNRQPVEIVGNGMVEGVKLVTTELGPADARGRRTPVVIPGSEEIVPADRVIVAFGFRPNPQPWFEQHRIAIDQGGRVIAK
jgi:glutamate synthase (NADPH/NADH) small chain